MGALIVSAFPCCGKSYYCQNNTGDQKLHDSDSSEFHFEKVKNVDKIIQKDWPQNYINHIRDIKNEYDIIFVSSHKDIRELLFKEFGNNYIIIYPKLKHENYYDWIGRAYHRGSPETFIDYLKQNFYNWIEELQDWVHEEKVQAIELRYNEFIDKQLINSWPRYLLQV